MNRRSVLSLLGLGSAGVLTAKGTKSGLHPARGFNEKALPFKPVQVALPVNSDGLDAVEQQTNYKELALEDRLTIPEGFRFELLAAWGDRLGTSRFGFNNDHLGFVQLDENEASMTINFEYISPIPWVQGFEEVVGRHLPIDTLIDALKPLDGVIDCTALKKNDRLWAQIRPVADEAMTDLGIGVMSLKRDVKGQWTRANAEIDRRITGINGLESPSERLLSSGPATAVFTTSERQGYDDTLGEKIIGTFANCGGGITPWGTVLSAEENFQNQVPEAVYADGSSTTPSKKPFLCREGQLGGLGNVYGLAGNKYGWIVEVDPSDINRPVVKHTALGRFRHEAVAVRAQPGQPLHVYSGCDRSGGHLYRYVSTDRIKEVKDKRNSILFEHGELQVARFNADGSGEWLALKPNAIVNPYRPSQFREKGLNCPVELPHSNRRVAGAEHFHDDAAVQAYCRQFGNLADLYRGKGALRQGAILVDAHLAASAIGATPTARPEDTKIDPISGDLLIAFTTGNPGSTGGADPAVFKGPDHQSSWPYGWVMRLSDSEKNSFTWRMVVTGGTPWDGGLGFSNPDNLALDSKGNMWIVTDKSSTADVYGNNSCWYIPRDNIQGKEAACFANGPMECELTGVCLDQPEETMFLAIQHPGELNGARAKGNQNIQTHYLVDRNGGIFKQRRKVPLGSNWPAQAPGRPPRPGVVSVFKRRDKP